MPHDKTALWIGVVCMIVGSWALYSYFEASGRKRPFVMKFLPSL